MEPKIRDFINQGLDDNYVETKHENKEQGFRCHLDGENDTRVLEIKTTSQIHNMLDDYKVYLVQLLFYMMNTSKQKGLLAIYERPEDFNEEFDATRLRTYDVDINDYDDLCNQIVSAVEQFKVDLEKLKENPLLSEEDLLPVPIQELSHELEMIEHQIEVYKDLEKQEKELKTLLFDAMNKYDVKKWRTPNGTLITRVDATEDKMEMTFNENRFKEEQPDMYNEYCEETLKKGKSGYVRITLGKGE